MYKFNRKEPPYVMSGDGTVFTPRYNNSFDRDGLEVALKRLRRETGFPQEKERKNFDNHND